MTIFGALVVFTIIWWLFFFMLLPWGVQREEAPEQGHDTGAPVRPMLWRKAIVATVLATAGTVAIWWLMESCFMDR